MNRYLVSFESNEGLDNVTTLAQHISALGYLGNISYFKADSHIFECDVVMEPEDVVTVNELSFVKSFLPYND